MVVNKPSSNNPETLHILIEGRVQGVGYRRFSQKEALRLGLCGWVRNLEDGRVEIKVTGLSENLQEFQRSLKSGPTFSSIRQIVVVKDKERFEKTFEILEDGRPR